MNADLVIPPSGKMSVFPASVTIPVQVPSPSLMLHLNPRFPRKCDHNLEDARAENASHKKSIPGSLEDDGEERLEER